MFLSTVTKDKTQSDYTTIALHSQNVISTLTSAINGHLNHCTNHNALSKIMIDTDEVPALYENHCQDRRGDDDPDDQIGI